MILRSIDTGMDNIIALIISNGIQQSTKMVSTHDRGDAQNRTHDRGDARVVQNSGSGAFDLSNLGIRTLHIVWRRWHKAQLCYRNPPTPNLT